MSTPDPALTEWVPLAVGGGGPIGPVGPAGPAGPQGPPGTGGIPALAGIVSDFNQALVSGLYFTTYNPANRPSWEGAIVNGAFALLVIKAAPGSGQGGDDDVYQITWRTEDQRMWMRSWQYGYWMDWTPLQMPNRLRENMSGQTKLTDWNSPTMTGWYWGSSSTLNTPTSVDGDIFGMHYQINTTTARQEVWPTGAQSGTRSKRWIRTKISSTWGPWYGIGTAALLTALPGNPLEGEEVIFTDSLTSPTYQWRLRYVPAKSTNKWVFVGGTPAVLETASQQNHATVGSYAALGTSNDFAIPIAGDYIIELGALLATGGAIGTALRMSYDIGATGAVDGDALTVMAPQSGAGNGFHAFRRKKKLGLTAVTLAVKYKTSSTNIYAQERTLSVTPIAVGG
jgi:hypothetical protein